MRSTLPKSFLGTVLAVCSTLTLAQNQPAPPPDSTDSNNSLVSAAQSAKSQKAGRAKKVFTDDDIEAMAGPLPRLKMTGPENSEEIIAAIAKYLDGHTREETETAVHNWYDRYDEMLAATIHGNREMSSIRTANITNGNDLCEESGDYEQCNYRRRADMRGMRSDQAEMISNTALMMRIQQAFRKVRTGLMQKQIQYEWFKIRINSVPESYD